MVPGPINIEDIGPGTFYPFISAPFIFDGKLGDQEYDASELAMALAGLPSVG